MSEGTSLASFFDSVPVEIVAKIFSFCDLCDIPNLCTVNKKWAEAEQLSWRQLVEVNFYHWPVHVPVMLSIIEKCPNATKIVLPRGISGSDIAALGPALQRFSTLTLAHGRRLTLDGLADMLTVNGPLIAELNLVSSKIPPHLFEELSSRRLNKFTHVNLSGSTVTDATLRRLRHCKQLESLNLSNCPGVGHKGLSRLLPNTPHLRHLYLYYNTHITNATLDLIATRVGPVLTELDLQGCPSITDQGFLRCVGMCARLKLLRMSECSNLTDASLAACARCTTLRELQCSDMPQISRTAIEHYLNTQTSLHFLMMYGTVQCNDEAILQLAQEKGVRLYV
eukprot:gnl/Trimastix_PCT/1563.p1 GENE.gnl/Trimastix_PCT/1563~~gnl/Trimastix_PCT/1563.p1  ORF type:complete len:347 (-),score=36.62 gnl/Trimastix_PCT/1563:239-1252(-)